MIKFNQNQHNKHKTIVHFKANYLAKRKPSCLTEKSTIKWTIQPAQITDNTIKGNTIGNKVSLILPNLVRNHLAIFTSVCTLFIFLDQITLCFAMLSWQQFLIVIWEKNYTYSSHILHIFYTYSSHLLHIIYTYSTYILHIFYTHSSHNQLFFNIFQVKRHRPDKLWIAAVLLTLKMYSVDICSLKAYFCIPTYMKMS